MNYCRIPAKASPHPHSPQFTRGPAANGGSGGGEGGSESRVWSHDGGGGGRGGRGVWVTVGLKAEFGPTPVFETFIVVNGQRWWKRRETMEGASWRPRGPIAR